MADDNFALGPEIPDMGPLTRETLDLLMEMVTFNEGRCGIIIGPDFVDSGFRFEPDMPWLD